ncbi:hypothetical protein HYZ80_03200 [Candidatus Parcubacteria bacterium]|nr:hypothetical protein [Candidatus Parcubacteria bacterium]
MVNKSRVAGMVRGATKKSRFGRWLAGALAALIALAGVSVWLLRAKTFELQEFTVAGTRNLDRTLVQHAFGELYSQRKFGFSNRNFFLSLLWPRPRNAEAALKNQFPEIASAAFTTLFPHTRILTLTERTQALLWCRAQRPPIPPAEPTATTTAALALPATGTEDIAACASVDQEGIAFRPALASQGALVVVAKDYRGQTWQLGKPVADQQLIHELLSINAAAPQEFGFPVAAFAVVPELADSFVGYGPSGIRIIVPRGELFGRQLANLGRFFKQEIRGDFSKIQEYVDARIENRVYYK